MMRFGVGNMLQSNNVYRTTFSRFELGHHFNTTVSFLEYQSRSFSDDQSKSYPRLVGKCLCGQVGWEAVGKPAAKFYCHCSLCRRASGSTFLGIAAFVPKRVTFHGFDTIDTFTPTNSKGIRCFCKHCHSYVAEDARDLFGVWALPVGLCDGQVDQVFYPHEHIFYQDRVLDVTDSLPKYLKFQDGQMAT